MKRNLFLIIGIMGLVLLDYGCQKDPTTLQTCEDRDAKITNIYISNMFERGGGVYSVIDPGDSVTFESFILQTGFNIRYVTSGEHKSNFGAYALMAPIAKTCFQVKNLKIEMEQRGVLKDISSLFSCYNNKLEYPGVRIKNNSAFHNQISESLAYTPLGLSLYMHSKPELWGSVRWKITVENIEGESFVTFSDKIYLK